MYSISHNDRDCQVLKYHTLSLLVSHLSHWRKTEMTATLAWKGFYVCHLLLFVVQKVRLFLCMQEDVMQKVQWMGGEVSKDFTEYVTHLVAGEVGSKKYIVS